MVTDDLIKSFLKGESSEEELKELRLWLNLPENQDKADALFKKKWQEISSDELSTDFNTKGVFQNIQARVRKLEQADRPAKVTRDRRAYEYPKKKRSWAGVKIFAGLALILGLGYFYMPEPELETAPKPQQFTKNAPRGYRNTVTLMDGSTATLNSESTITYDTSFGKETRTIYLTGEAFFKVAHDPSKPFIVISKDLKTTALGTSFNVNAYAENNTAISLATGKVKVELTNSDTTAADRPQIILSPGEQAVWTGITTGLIKRAFDPMVALSWKNNIIYFDKTPLQNMINILEKWYDVKITVDKNGNNKLLKETGTGRFKNESLENVLSSLGYSMGFTYQINKKSITLKLTEE